MLQPRLESTVIPCGGVPAYMEKTFPSEACFTFTWCFVHMVPYHKWFARSMLQEDQMKLATSMDETFPGEDRQAS